MATFLSNFSNFDLLSVGIAVAGMLILGFVTFLNNLKSASNRTIFYLAIAASAWGIINYAAYQTHTPEIAFWLLRLVMFCSIWAAFFTFSLALVFPSAERQTSRFYTWFVIPLAIVTAAATLTPFVFSKIAEVGADGSIIRISNGPGIALYGFTITLLNIGGVFLLIRKIIRSKKEERKPLIIVLFGVILMLALIMVFNFVLPAFLENTSFIPLGALFLFPFIALTSYAILRHKLMGVKVVATEILTFVLAIVSLGQVIFSENLASTVFSTGVFILVLSFGIMLIRSVQREVEQRERLQKLTTELAEKNEKLKELDKLKDEFLSFASHDLKSPVAKMKQWASLIYDKTYNTPPQIEDTAFKIKNTADRAIRLVDEFLNIRKLEEGKIEYVFEDKDIVAFAKGLVSDFELIAKQKNLAVSFNGPANPIICNIDTTKIRQVIENLIDNSIKYTETGSIAVTVTEEQKSVLISIKDTGGGMEKEILGDLFTQFKREAGVAKKIQGTGLGLYIAKQFVIGHHGEVWAESEGRGKGSQFYVRLPKK